MVRTRRRSDTDRIDYRLGYVVATLAAIAAAQRADGRERQFWVIAAIALTLLGVNKQLDLQSWLTAALRDAARAQGWYAERRELQALFLFGLGITAFAAWLAMLAWLARTSVKLALAGLTMLLVFVLVRAASFHHIDAALRSAVYGLRLYQALEAAGILIVAIAAIAFVRRKPGQAR